MSWTNSDGLTIYFGGEEATLSQAGEYRTDGLYRVEDIEVNLASLAAGAALVTRQLFPWGKVLGRVEVIADIPAVGGTSVSFGFVNVKTSVAIATAGAVSALVTASMTPEGNVIILTPGSTSAGTLVGTTVAATKGTVIGVTGLAVGTYTSGRVRLRLFWYKKTATT